MLWKIIQFSRMMYYNFQQFFLYKRFEDSTYAWVLKRLNILGPLKVCHVNSLSNWGTKFEKKKLTSFFLAAWTKQKQSDYNVSSVLYLHSPGPWPFIRFFHISVQSFCSKINKPFKALNQLYGQFVSPSLPKNHLQ